MGASQPLGLPTTIIKINAKHSAVVLVAMYGLEAASNSISSTRLLFGNSLCIPVLLVPGWASLKIGYPKILWFISVLSFSSHDLRVYPIFGVADCQIIPHLRLRDCHSCTTLQRLRGLGIRCDRTEPSICNPLESKCEFVTEATNIRNITAYDFQFDVFVVCDHFGVEWTPTVATIDSSSCNVRLGCIPKITCNRPKKD